MRWGRGARYARAVRRAFDGFSLASTSAYATADRNLERLAPPVAPPAFAAEHERLQGLEAASLAERVDRATPYPERARAVTAAVRAAADMAERLAGAASTPDEERYAADLAERLAARREHFAAAAEVAERGGDRALERLARTVPPGDAAAEHAALVAALGRELDARRAIHAAARELDPDASAAAARAYEARRDELTAASQALAERLGIASPAGAAGAGAPGGLQSR